MEFELPEDPARRDAYRLIDMRLTDMRNLLAPIGTVDSVALLGALDVCELALKASSDDTIHNETSDLVHTILGNMVEAMRKIEGDIEKICALVTPQEFREVKAKWDAASKEHQEKFHRNPLIEALEGLAGEVGGVVGTADVGGDSGKDGPILN